MRDDESQVSSSSGAALESECDVLHSGSTSGCDEAARAEVPVQQKRLYRKPSYRYERIFETMALACSKIHPTQFECRFNRKNS